MIAAVTMVKDEADIIEATVRHLLDEGIDQVYVLDNMSTDGTQDILDRLVGEFPVRVHWFEDRDPAYYQARKMNGLAALAAEHGATWILPFDADEFWYCPQGRLKLAVESCEAQVIYARSWNQVGDRRHPMAKGFPKVCYRWNPDAYLHQGAHDVDWPGAHQRATGLEIREYQYRSFEQLVRKVRNGKAAYDATDLPESEGAHWRQMGSMSDVELHELWRQHVAAATEVDPVPWGEA
jgi:hypothetical protein